MPVNIRGKMYSTVDERLREFRALFPASEGWSLTCEILTIDDEQVTLTARITDPAGRVVGQGHAQEFKKASRINSTSMVENAETSAWGRALACIGYFGDGNFAIATAEEVTQALDTQAANRLTDKQREEFWLEDLKGYQLTVDDVNKWAEAINFGSKWGEWDIQVKARFMPHLKTRRLKTQRVIEGLLPLEEK